MLSQARKAIAAFLTGVVTTIGSVTVAIQQNADQVVATTLGVRGAVSSIASSLLVYCTTN